MTLFDIEQIENTLSINLPEELKEKYTSNILDGIEEFPEIMGYFMLNADEIIKMNQRLRKKGLWKKPFPEYLLVIGRDEGREYYIADLRESPLRVFRVMNNKTWAYDPEDLSKNTVLPPPHEGIGSYIESMPLFHLHLHREARLRKELGVPEPEISGDDMNKMLEQRANGTFREEDWPQIYDEIYYKAREKS